MFELIKRFFKRRSALEQAFVDDAGVTLHEYVFIDRLRLKAYVQQIEGPRRQESVPSWDMSLSVSGPSFHAGRATSARDFTDHEMVRILVSHLRKHDLVTYSEPAARADAKTPFAFESISARKAILSLHGGAGPRDLKEIAIWVSPPPGDSLDEPGFTNGSFLYLVEAYWGSDDICYRTHSGFSAFNAIVKDLTERNVLQDVPKPFQRGRKLTDTPLPTADDHLYDVPPLEALAQLGARIQPPRNIEVLYRKRYMSDEESFVDANGAHRCRDLFAYPIFIRDIPCAKA